MSYPGTEDLAPHDGKWERGLSDGFISDSVAIALTPLGPTSGYCSGKGAQKEE